MRKFLSVTALIVLLVSGIGASMQALPIGSSGHEDVFYSDDTYTTIVGGNYMECNGYPDRWGEVTPYRESYTWSCGPQPGTYCQRYICSECWTDPFSGETYCFNCTYNGVCAGCEFGGPCGSGGPWG